MRPLIIGIAGGSGSGKTTFANKLAEALGSENCSHIRQDNYYIDQSAKFDHDGGSVNFDHPEALDFNLMAKQLHELKAGQSIEVPIYDFASHSRQEKTLHVGPKPFILLDGILIFSQQNILDELDYSIYIDCPEELRFERRLNRDTVERGRTPEGVKNQFINQVKPMHDEFVEPSRSKANQVVTIENFQAMIEYCRNELIKY